MRGAIAALAWAWAWAPCAQDLREVRAQFEEAVRTHNPDAARRLAKEVAAFDSKPAVEILIDAQEETGAMTANLEAERDRLRKIETAFGGLVQEILDHNDRIQRLQSVGQAIPDDLIQKGERLTRRQHEWAQVRMDIRAVDDRMLQVMRVRDAAASGLAAFRSDGAVGEVIKAMRRSKSWFTRAAAARSLARNPHVEAGSALLDHLVKGKEEGGVLVAAIDALAERGEWSPEVIDAVTRSLATKSWPVRTAAARALGRSGSLAVVEPLLRAFVEAEGRLKDDLRAALVGVTSIDKGPTSEAWRIWFDRHRDDVLAGTWKPRSDERVGSGGPVIATGVTFYGIPVKSTSVVFVIDRSGSMAEPGAYDEAGERIIETGVREKGPRALRDLQPDGTRKIDIAKYQLKKVLWSLPEGTRFNIVFYNHGYQVLSDKMLTLTSSTRSKAFRAIDPLEPVGETDIWQALQAAMAHCTRPGLDGEPLDDGADTIYVLSDGLPFPPSVVVGPADILDWLKFWNRDRKVVMHTVFVSAADSSDYSDGRNFMERLAGENLGVFKAPEQPGR